MRIPRCLTIAGSDSGGGAGLQADLKTFEALGCFGMSAVTALTAQNTREVRSVRLLDPQFVVEQIAAVVEDIGVDAAKTGMLGDAAITRAVARALAQRTFPVVVDPVMVAKSGARLLAEEAVATLKEELLPRATLITPNAPEAEVLAGLPIRSTEDQVEAAMRLARDGPAVLVKGGHLPGEEAVDVLVVGGEVHFFRRPKVHHPHTHGTGCVLSAAICAFLAHGAALPEAVAKAEAFLTRALLYALDLGTGHGPVHPMAHVRNAAAKAEVLEELERAVSLLGPDFRELVPEVGSNLALATPFAMGEEDVAGLDGRIVRTVRGVRVGVPRFGASRHMARVLLTARRFDPSLRAALNLRFGEDVLRAAERAGLSMAAFDRAGEPAEEGQSLPWGVSRALAACGHVPDLIYDRGGPGKEPMVRLLGRSAEDVVRKALRILACLREEPHAKEG
ncbi:MAG: bifunctional hydroxymethylpyrimidine kinase/phosphomethylpyrimidine kinase [Candidatus Bipolaricaulota bacterium]|nr:bifunctional hydroxymethylpyrimidine kinase/phosphomethylpyrimidine kinase [Candidatus Bipolaricaulota bacterium]